MNADLQQFVREALGRGVPRERIHDALRAARWPEDEIAVALSAWDDAGLGVPVPRRRVQLSAREAFLYLLLYATLYVVAFHTGLILFAWIERAFPDPALADTAWDHVRGNVRFGVASLLVAFPVFLWTSRLLGRAIAGDPETRSSGVRRWLTWLTLFVAACVLIGDFIAVVLGLLNGEMTSRFALKALVVGLIAGVLFLHYVEGLRREESEAPAAPARSPWLARAAGIGVVAVLGVGLMLAGSPGHARQEQLDRKRVRDLDGIRQSVESWYAVHHRLPDSQAPLDFYRREPGARRDPLTHLAYEYAIVDSVTFRLCATFSAPDSIGPWEAGPSDFWRHGSGRSCFTFHVGS